MTERSPDLSAWTTMVLFAFGVSVPVLWSLNAVTIAVAVVLAIPFLLNVRSITRGEVAIRQPLSNLWVWAGTIVFVLVVASEAWAGNTVDRTSILNMVVFALPLAGIYAMSASGLVVVYTTTGVFNFAQGAIGMFMAYVYWSFTQEQSLPTWLALPLVVLVVAPLFGVLLDRAIMRKLQGQVLVVQLMVTVGLMFALIGLANIIWDQNIGHTLPPLFGGEGFNIGDVLFTWHRFATIVVAILLAFGLRILLFRTRIGIAMRAVVDNPALASLSGARAAVLSSFSWALGCSLAALAGILLAPEANMATSGALTLLIITSFSAAVVGRLRSLPMVYLGALILALGRSFSNQFLVFSEQWSKVPDALPVIMLFIVLLLLPRAQLEFARIRTTRRVERVSTVRDTIIGMSALLVVMGVVAHFFEGDTNNLSAFTVGMCTALIALSLVPLIGWAGQVSLAPLAFAAIGAVMYVRLDGVESNRVVLALATVACGAIGGWVATRVVRVQTGFAAVIAVASAVAGFLLYLNLGSIFVASLICVPVGALLAFPAMRLQGLYLALLTLAFASFVELLFFSQRFALGPQTRAVPPIELFGYEFDQQVPFLMLVTALFGVCAVGVVALRRSPFGRRLVALRDSEAASVTVGVNVLETKLAVFSLSAAMAGFGGAFFAMQRGTLSQAQGFEMLAGLPIVLALVIGGVAFVSGALFAGLFGLAVVLIQDNWDLTLWRSFELLAPGLAAFGIIQNPSGAVVPIGEAFARFLPWREDARREYEQAKEAAGDAEVGALGLQEPFEESDVMLADRELGITNEVPRAVRTGA